MPIDSAWLDSLDIRLLSDDMDLSTFTCNKEIDWFLHQVSRMYHQKRITTVTCWLLGKVIAGYVATAMSHVDFKDEPQMKRHFELAGITLDPVTGRQSNRFPALLIGFLGVHQDYRNRGLGARMVQSVVGEALSLSETTGCRFVTVDSQRSAEAIGLYKKNSFELVRDDPGRATAWMILDLGLRGS